MIGLVLVTHGRLATEFVAALEHVVGAQGALAAIPIGPDDDSTIGALAVHQRGEARECGQP